MAAASVSRAARSSITDPPSHTAEERCRAAVGPLLRSGLPARIVPGDDGRSSMHVGDAGQRLQHECCDVRAGDLRHDAAPCDSSADGPLPVLRALWLRSVGVGAGCVALSVVKLTGLGCAWAEAAMERDMH